MTLNMYGSSNSPSIDGSPRFWDFVGS